MIKIFFLLFISSQSSFAEDLCKFFKYCGSTSRSSAQSIPTSSSAAGLNPGNISTVKGFGIETIYQPNNSLSSGIITGNGKVGALVSTTLENSFFGNRSIEIDDVYFERRRVNKQYKNKKLSLAMGSRIVDKRNIGLNLGLSVKRNPDIKKLNPGAGVSLRFYAFNFGAYFYKDDVRINLGNYINPYSGIMYRSIYNESYYQEKFSVLTYTIGTKIQNLSLDYGYLKTRYKFYNDITRISLYSSSYSYKKFLFNLAFRYEYSPNLTYLNDTMVVSRSKNDVYYGIQYLVNRYLVLGIQYNNFLLNELSAGLILFF